MKIVKASNSSNLGRTPYVDGATCTVNLKRTELRHNERYSGINTVLLTAFSTEEVTKVLYDIKGTTDIHKCKTRKKSFQSYRLIIQK